MSTMQKTSGAAAPSTGKTDRPSKKRPEFMTKSRLKSERGWSDRAMEVLLGPCDVESPNPHYGCAAPMKLYRIARILKAERTLKFARFRDAKERRSKAAQEAAERKTEKLLDEIGSLEIEVPRIDNYKQLACEHYNNLWASRGRDKYATVNDNKEFLDRISVNFLRHEMSDYEESLVGVRGAVGAQDARIWVKERVLGEIAVTYPELAEECRRQIVEANRPVFLGQ